MTSSGRRSRLIPVKLPTPEPHDGRWSSSSGRASARMKIGWVLDQVAMCSMKSSRLGSAHWRSSKTRTTGVRSETRSKNRRQAANSSSRSNAASSARAEQRGEAWLDPAPLGLVADELLERRTELPARELGRRAVRDPGPAADHLRHRGERDSLSVGEGAAVVPRDLVGVLVDPTVELPRQPALADARDARHRHQAAASVSHDAGRQVGQLHELSIATDQRPGVRAAGPTGGTVCRAGRSERLEPTRPSPERERSDRVGTMPLPTRGREWSCRPERRRRARGSAGGQPR